LKTKCRNYQPKKATTSSRNDVIAKTNSALDILKGIQEFNVKGGGNNTLAQGKIITEK
jgi:hypothetical protein